MQLARAWSSAPVDGNKNFWLIVSLGAFLLGFLTGRLSPDWDPFEQPYGEHQCVLKPSSMTPSSRAATQGLPAAERLGGFYKVALNTWGGEWSKTQGKGTYYYRTYGYFLEQFRTLGDMQMLEIGLDRGHSLNFWKSYFPCAHIVGTDIKEKSRMHDSRVRIFQADQKDVHALQKMLDALKVPGSARNLSRTVYQPFHLIVDDASHYPSDTLASFEHLFLHGLLPGGVYTLEDLSTSYDQFKGIGLYGHSAQDFEIVGRQRAMSVINYFKEMADLVNRRWEAPPRGYKAWTFTYQDERGKRLPSTSVAEWVSSITITQSLVVVVKKSEDEYARWPYSCDPSKDKLMGNGVCQE